MPNVDQFESVFRAATREVFAYAPIAVRRVMVVTDLPETEAYPVGEKLKNFLSVLGGESSETAWDIVPGPEFRSVDDLLKIVEKAGPDLIITWRHLHSPVSIRGSTQGHTLGDHAAELTQSINIPVMLCPHPKTQEPNIRGFRGLENTNVVMAMTNHLSGDNRLVNWAVRLTEPQGTLWLTHIEDERTFARYLDAISKIDTIDTDNARETIRDRLLSDPRNFIDSCQQVLHEAAVPLTIEQVVTTGRHLREYQSLIEKHAVDLLILNTKDEEQMAMHGLAYALAVELRHIPLLLL